MSNHIVFKKGRARIVGSGAGMHVEVRVNSLWIRAGRLGFHGGFSVLDYGSITVALSTGSLRAVADMLEAYDREQVRKAAAAQKSREEKRRAEIERGLAEKKTVEFTGEELMAVRNALNFSKSHVPASVREPDGAEESALKKVSL